MSGGVGAGYVVQSARCCSIWFNAVASSPALGMRLMLLLCVHVGPPFSLVGQEVLPPGGMQLDTPVNGFIIPSRASTKQIS